MIHDDQARGGGSGRASAPPRRTGWPARLAALLAGACLLAGCADPQPRRVAGGDPERGPGLIRGYGCHACHMIPGVEGADALVGPPLIHWGQRVYIAGHLPNTPENLIRWIMHPQEFHEHTVMPDMGVSERDARDIAAYLLGLR